MHLSYNLFLFCIILQLFLMEIQVFLNGSIFVRDFSQIILELIENEKLKSLKMKNRLRPHAAKCQEDFSSLRRLSLHDFLALFIIALLIPFVVIFIYYLPSIKSVYKKIVSLLTGILVSQLMYTDLVILFFKVLFYFYDMGVKIT